MTETLYDYMNRVIRENNSLSKENLELARVNCHFNELIEKNDVDGLTKD